MTRATRHLRILVVDDEPMYRALAEAILGARGDEVVTVESAGQALALAVRTPFDVIVTDAALCDLEGGTLTGELGARFPGQAIVITARDPEDLALATVGDVASLSKPFTADELLGAIEVSLSPEDHAAA
jgi:CheY-like chemotaxis protein